MMNCQHYAADNQKRESNSVFVILTALLFLTLGFSATLEATTEHLLPTETTMEKNERRARQKLGGISQEHIFKYWGDLDEKLQEALLSQIDKLDVPSFRWQQDVLKNREMDDASAIDSFTDFAKAGGQAEIELGRQLIAQGKVGCLIVAGGQGTRLRMEGPKGKYPISPIKKKTLFQIFAEKTLAAGKQAGKMLHLAIMTSPQNHEETVRFFAGNENFGLSTLQLSFFCQGTLPLLDKEGNLFLEEKHKVSCGPDGNGSCLQSFVESGIWEKWKRSGIEAVNFVLIDNPLADPFDANLVGFQASRGDAVTIKCVERVDPAENVGIIIKKNGHAAVVEYTEVPPEEQAARLYDGSLKHACANISLFCFSMDFIQEAAAATAGMVLHPAFKAVKALDDAGCPVVPLQPNAWKFERFIFDVLPGAETVSALVYPRERCFAPLKSFQGSNSPETVRAAMQNLDRWVLEELTGLPAPSHAFELSQDFYYPTEVFRQQWRGCVLPVRDYYP